MQIVIDISDDDYNNIKNYTGFLAYYEYLIKNGTPLPKGHGDLIDRSELMPDSDYDDGTFYAVSIGAINGAPTIIEADRSEED